jgi:ankyrin repeat protein
MTYFRQILLTITAAIILTHSYAQTSCAEQTPIQTPRIPAIEEITASALDGNNETLKTAISNGFDPNKQDTSGRTLMMFAAYNGHTKTVEMLIKAGADINIKDFGGTTPLMWASSGPFVETVSLLLQNGADINAVDYDEHFSALMWAASEGQAEVVTLLLKNKAAYTLKDKDGDTAESFAVKKGHTEAVNILKSAAAQKN